MSVLVLIYTFNPNCLHVPNLTSLVSLLAYFEVCFGRHMWEFQVN